jgi:hypothetical protein
MEKEKKVVEGGGIVEETKAFFLLVVCEFFSQLPRAIPLVALLIFFTF